MSRRNGRRPRQIFHRHLLPPSMTNRNGKGGAPADRFAGAVPFPLRRSGAGTSRRSSSEPICTCPPIVPGWPDASIKIAAISASGFWQTVQRPCVFRLVDVADATAEEEAAIDAGLFIFLVRPGREDADTKALADVMQRPSDLIYGEPVDFSGAGKTWMQIVAVLTDEEER